MTQGLGILDGILNEIASAFSKPRNDGDLIRSPIRSGNDIVENLEFPKLELLNLTFPGILDFRLK